MSKQFQNGQKLYTVGLNSKCKPIVTTAMFVEYREPRSGMDCIINTGSFKMWSDSASLFETKAEAKKSM